jgi:hypothetical protein
MGESWIKRRALARKEGTLDKSPLPKNNVNLTGGNRGYTGYRGFSDLIKELTRDGEDIANLLVDIVKCNVKGGATTRERLMAAQMLLDRMHGKVPDKVQLTHEAPDKPVIDVSGWTTEQLRQAKALQVAIDGDDDGE